MRTSARSSRPPAPADGNDPEETLVHVVVDIVRCTGHARCFAVAPDVYDLDDDGYCRIPAPEVAPDLEPQARDGAAACPELAITATG
jgi:ferredoxin